MTTNAIYVRGHPFMTSTNMGEGGVQPEVDACGQGEGGVKFC